MTVAEGPRDRARRETQLELNWSVLGRALGRGAGGQNEQNFPGVSVGGDRARDRSRTTETEGPASRNQCDIFCGRRKNSNAQRTPAIDPFPFFATRLVREQTIVLLLDATWRFNHNPLRDVREHILYGTKCLHVSLLQKSLFSFFFYFSWTG